MLNRYTANEALKHPSYVFIFHCYSFSKVSDSKHNKFEDDQKQNSYGSFKKVKQSKWGEKQDFLKLFSKAHFLTPIEHTELDCV